MAGKSWSCLTRLVVLAGMVVGTYGIFMATGWLHERSALSYDNLTYLISLTMLIGFIVVGIISDRKQWWLFLLMLAAFIALTIGREIKPEHGDPGIVMDMRHNLDLPAVVAMLLWAVWTLVVSEIGGKVFGPWETKDKIEV